MTKKPSTKKKEEPAKSGYVFLKEKKPPPESRGGIPFGRKKLGYRTPKRFRRQVFRRIPASAQRTRSLGGHR